jgi:protein-tyrosine-phosphatase
MEKEKLNKSKKTATGSTRDEIEVRPKDKKLNEATKGKTAVLTFGRMNPPTIGHEVLVQTVLKTARASSGTPLIFLSHSSDPKKNPLSYDEKVRLAQAAFGRNIVVKSPARTIIEVLKTLTGSFDNVKVVVGSDRVSEFERILKTYNGRDFKFKSVEVVSAGTRDPDAEGVSGMSASKMRDLAGSNDKNGFKKGLPKNLKSMSDMVLTMVRAGMKLAEELEAEGILYLDEAVLSVAQRRKKALAAKRYKSRLSFARNRQSKRMASTKRIAKRSARAAIRLMRRRLAGKKGLNYSKLSAGEKSAIDKRVQARKGVLKKLAKRLAPKVRRAEISRLRTRNESFDIYFDKYLQEMDTSIQVNSLEEVYAIVDKFLDSIHSPLLTEKAVSNIRKRSEKTGIDVNELFEAYYSGYKEPAADETPEEAGFKNMNQFIKSIVIGETKGAPKGYHFTSDGKLKKGDADIDGKGGKMLRADPLDKQRSKIPPLPEDMSKAVDKRQEKELRNIQIRHARQDASAKTRDLMSKANEEFEQIDELYFKAKIGDLPPIFVDASSAGAVKRDLRKILKRPDEIIKSIERQTPSSVRKHFRDMAKGTDLDTQDEIDEMFENFIDGKNPQDKGDSARHGIPKKATKSELEKIRSSDSASPRKKQLAHFQLNMRKGKE